MIYAILAYHLEEEVAAWTAAEDAGVMADLRRAHDRINRDKVMGPAARLGPTAKAVTLRGAADGLVLDGPFAETKEQLLGFYVVECATQADAVAAARALRTANPTAVYEIRPIEVYLPGRPLAAP